MDGIAAESARRPGTDGNLDHANYFTDSHVDFHAMPLVEPILTEWPYGKLPAKDGSG